MSKRFFYAQLDGLKVVALSDLSDEVIAPNMILLKSLTDVQLGDIYQDGKFITASPETND